MAAETSRLTIELHGFLAERLADLGRRRGTRTIIDAPLAGSCVGDLLDRLVERDARFGLLFDVEHARLPVFKIAQRRLALRLSAVGVNPVHPVLARP